MYAEMLLLAISFQLVPPTQLHAAAQGLPLHRIEAHVIEKTNSERRRHGLPALQVDGYLVRSARRHTAWMTRSHNLQHTTNQVGENIAMGQRSSKEVVQAWMDSSGHRANILNPNYRKIGVAAYTADDGTVFWCQQFLY